MEINWDSIRYFFQIPRDWFRYIHRKIHNAYGTLFIRVMDGEYGGMKIDIDKQVFKETVEDAIALDEYVKSVDDVTPDENGNVKLEGYVKSVNDVEPDENGNVSLDANYLEPSDITTQGIVVGTDYNGEQTVCSPNHKHNVKDVEGSVKTVNDVKPDQNGNIKVDTLKSVNGIVPDEAGNVDLGTLVKSVNDHQPDENGKISFSVVERVDGVQPVDGNVPLGAIRSINNTIRPVNGNVDLTNVFAPVEHTHPHTQISDWSNATKDFLKADELTSPGIVVGTDYDDADHPVCSPNHKHNAKDIVNDETNGFVTLDTEQTITGKKTFTTNVYILSGSNGFAFAPETNTMTFGRAALGWVGDAVVLGSPETAVQISLGKNLAVIESSGGSKIQVSDVGVQVLSKLSGGLTSGSELVEVVAPVSIDGVGTGIIHLNATANKARLTNQPTDTGKESLAIATCGYVQKNALTVPDGKELKTYDAAFVSDVKWDGTKIIVNKRVLEFTNGVLTAVKNAASNTIDTVAYSPS